MYVPFNIFPYIILSYPGGEKIPKIIISNNKYFHNPVVKIESSSQALLYVFKTSTSKLYLYINNISIIIINITQIQRRLVTTLSLENWFLYIIVKLQFG